MRGRISPLIFQIDDMLDNDMLDDDMLDDELPNFELENDPDL